MSDTLDLNDHPELSHVADMLRKAETELKRLGYWDNLEMLVGWVPCTHYYKNERELASSQELVMQYREVAEIFESELDEYHGVDRNCPDAASHYPQGWERSEEAKDKLEALSRSVKTDAEI